MAIIMVLNNVKDKETFFMVKLMKLKFHNHFSIHLNLESKCMRNFLSHKFLFLGVLKIFITL